MLTIIKIKIDIKVIHLLENERLFLKLNGNTIFDFGKIFPNNSKIIFGMNKIIYTKRFDFFSFDMLSFY